jgi:hypothetical protein
MNTVGAAVPNDQASRRVQGRTSGAPTDLATVCLADDVRHKRKVAIKVLKPELAAAPLDALTLVAVTTLILGIALVASLVPAIRAARTSPAVTMRED